MLSVRTALWPGWSMGLHHFPCASASLPSTCKVISHCPRRCVYGTYLDGRRFHARRQPSNMLFSFRVLQSHGGRATHQASLAVTISRSSAGLRPYSFRASFEAPLFLAKLTVVMVLTYFLLTHQEAFLLKAVKAVPTFQDKRRVVDIAKEIRTSIARYLLSVTLLNLSLRACVGIGLALLGLSSALMWGVAVFLLNYIPFIGAVAGISLVAIASLIQFENIGYACLAPLLYLALNALESNFVTPNILERWMTLNPVGIFLSFLFWDGCGVCPVCFYPCRS